MCIYVRTEWSQRDSKKEILVNFSLNIYCSHMSRKGSLQHVFICASECFEGRILGPFILLSVFARRAVCGFINRARSPISEHSGTGIGPDSFLQFVLLVNCVSFQKKEDQDTTFLLARPTSKELKKLHQPLGSNG